jgi:hypothetical protein
MMDRVLGDWHWKADERGEPARSLPKAGMWKCPNHYGRALIELLERLP